MYVFLISNISGDILWEDVSCPTRNENIGYNLLSIK